MSYTYTYILHVRTYRAENNLEWRAYYPNTMSDNGMQNASTIGKGMTIISTEYLRKSFSFLLYVIWQHYVVEQWLH
jgi:hypothetical protein